MIETSATIQALCYILDKIKQADKLKLVKLLFIADKYHLVQFGRTITNDDYWAMPYGPVGSTAKDVLSLDPDFLSEEEYKYAVEMLKPVDEHSFVHDEVEDFHIAHGKHIEAFRNTFLSWR